MSTFEDTGKPGDLLMWHIPQVLMKAFTVPVKTYGEGLFLLSVLSDYDYFQFVNKVKGDYCNTGGVVMWVPDCGEGAPGWTDYEEEEYNHWLDFQAEESK